MAEAFFNQYAKHSKAESAALHAPQNNMHALVVRAMQEKGIDISKKRSKKITQEIINRAGLIVLMHSDLKSYLNTEKPIEVWDIPDLIIGEKDEHLYPEVIKRRDNIEKKVEELITRLS